MHVLICDSGVGGLSVCAYAERFVRTHGAAQPVRLTFANAAPANDYGYNAMATREEKLATFERFLRNMTARFAPDLIYVACNTLSVLLPEMPVVAHGILDTAVDSVMEALTPGAVAIVFGTVTTIESGVYPRMLGARGATRVLAQACPGLADVISEDRGGERSRAEITRWVGAAVAQLEDRSAPVVACLACTHYGYRKQLFADALAAAGLRAIVVDPNERAVDELFAAGWHREAPVEVVSRYVIPETARDALAFYLGAISARTVEALRNFIHDPALF